MKGFFSIDPPRIVLCSDTIENEREVRVYKVITKVDDNSAIA